MTSVLSAAPATDARPNAAINKKKLLMCTSPGANDSYLFVFDAAAVGLGGGRGDLFAVHGFVHRRRHVVVRALDVFLFVAGLVIDGALVDHVAGGIDDEHVGGIGGAV